MCGKAGELVRMRTKRQAGQFGDFLCRALGKFWVSVQTRAHGRAADRQIQKTIERHGDPSTVAVQKADPPGKFLADRKRGGVLKVRAANFYDPGELLRLCVDRVAKLFKSRQKPARSLRGSGDVHRSRKCVVRRLRHINVIVRMNGLLAAHFSARNLDGAVRNHFVDVHVRLRAAAGLPDAQRKMLMQLPGNHLIRRLSNQIDLFFRKFPQIAIYKRGGLLQDAEAANQLAGHGVFAYGEMDQGARRLCAVVAIQRNLDFAHAVRFGAGRNGFGELCGVGHEGLLRNYANSLANMDSDKMGWNGRRLGQKMSIVVMLSAGRVTVNEVPETAWVPMGTGMIVL